MKTTTITIESPTAERLEIEALFSCTSPDDWAAQQRLELSEAE